jgi:hypothetical protein
MTQRDNGEHNAELERLKHIGIVTPASPGFSHPSKLTLKRPGLDDLPTRDLLGNTNPWLRQNRQWLLKIDRVNERGLVLKQPQGLIMKTREISTSSCGYCRMKKESVFRDNENCSLENQVDHMWLFHLL